MRSEECPSLTEQDKRPRRAIVFGDTADLKIMSACFLSRRVRCPPPSGSLLSPWAYRINTDALDPPVFERRSGRNTLDGSKTGHDSLRELAAQTQRLCECVRIKETGTQRGLSVVTLPGLNRTLPGLNRTDTTDWADDSQRAGKMEPSWPRDR